MHLADIRLLRNVADLRRHAVYDMLYLRRGVAPAADVYAVVIEVVLCRNADLEALTAAVFLCLNVKCIGVTLKSLISAFPVAVNG